MSNCVVCKKEAAFQLQEWYCNACFCAVLERRIKKYIRAECPLQKGDHVIVVGDLAHYILKKIIQGLPVKMECRETIPHTLPPHTKLILPWTMDKEASIFLDDLFQGKLVYDNNPHVIKLFLSITIPELKKYAEILHIHFSEEEHNTVFDILNQLEEKYPSTKYSLVKSVRSLHNIMQNANIKKIMTSNQEHDNPREN